MRTELTTSIERAAAFIKNGGVVAFPTETVYGLGADAFDERAMAKIFTAKQRPVDNPLIAHIGEKAQIVRLVESVPPLAERLIEAFFPGALTVVLKRSAQVPAIVTAGLETIGIRMPGNSLANEFLRACGTPVAAPSANLSGRPSPTTWRAVLEDLDGRIDCILQGESTEIGLESTVVDCTGGEPILLRAGAVSLDDLQRIVPSTRLRLSADPDEIRSPGMRHKHYAPSARVQIVDRDTELSDIDAVAFIGMSTPDVSFVLVKICGSVEEYARSVFAFFRECDRAGVKIIYCERVDESGIGAALMDRLSRAEAG